LFDLKQVVDMLLNVPEDGCVACESGEFVAPILDIRILFGLFWRKTMLLPDTAG